MDNKKAPQADTGKAQESIFDAKNNTTLNSEQIQEVDPVVGWFSLGANVKPSRERTPKKSWTRGSK